MDKIKIFKDMRSVFRSKFQVTQGFGERPEYYKKFGLKGHEGLDIIPTGTVWDVLCLADGVVVNETDDPRSGVYGIWCTVWHPQLRKATQYCHLQSNIVSSGDKVTTGQRLGIMGATGNSTGAHLHLNLYETDENGFRLNKNNGFNGGIDPLPFLQEETNQPTLDLQAELNKTREERDRNWNWFSVVCEALGIAANVETAVAEVKKLLTLEDALVQKDRKIKDLQDQIIAVEAELAGKTAMFSGLSEKNKELEEQVAKLTNAIAESQKRIDGALLENKSLVNTIQKLKNASEIPVRTGWQLIVEGLKKLLERR